MALYTSSKIKLFRVIYLIASAAICAYTVFLLTQNILSGIRNTLTFRDTVNLFALLFALLLESSIVLFIVRSLRSGVTILMKHLVFKPDGTPYRLGVVLCATGGIVFSALSVLVFISTYGADFLHPMLPQMQRFIADITMIFGVNLLFAFAYFLLFRHESGTFRLI